MSDDDDTDDILEAKLRLQLDKSTKFCIIFVKLIVKPNPDLLKHIVPVSMEQNYEIYLKITLSQSVLHGGKVLDAFDSFQTTHTQHS